MLGPRLGRLWRQGRELFNLARELLAPRLCYACKQPIEEGCLCPVCRRGYLLGLAGRYQPRQDEYSAALAPYCLEDDHLDQWLCLLRYEGVVQELLGKLKFQREERLLQLLQEEAQLALPPRERAVLLAAYDDVACIPTSPERLRQRGFDVPQEVFAFLGGSGKLRRGLLLRQRPTPPLFNLGPVERRQAVAGCFSLDPAYRGRLAGRRILLCDDIFTTGSTLGAAAALLRRQGAAYVGALTLAAPKEAEARLREVKGS